MSLAGATLHPAPTPIPSRTGGFGGAEGLAAYLRAHRVERLIDATHPFAARITANAHAAAAATGTPLLRLRRPEWTSTPGDQWLEATDMQQAADHLGPTPKRVLLTVGRNDLAPFRAAPHHHYFARSIDPPPPDLLPPGAEQILARPPHHLDEELALLERHRIQIIVTKSSGGDATRAKLDAARARRVPVVMVARPIEPTPGALAATVAEALAWLEGGPGLCPWTPPRASPWNP
jgi:precorrin-6A/cobalt-precorrin-6A reductase